MNDQEVYDAWAHTPSETLKHYRVDEKRGLSEEEVEARRERYGWNELEKPPSASIWALIFQQFDDMLVKVCWLHLHKYLLHLFNADKQKFQPSPPLLITFQ